MKIYYAFSDDDFVITEVIKKSITFLKIIQIFLTFTVFNCRLMYVKKILSNPDSIDLPMVNFNDIKNIKIMVIRIFYN